MGYIKQELIKKAIRKFGSAIRPCGNRPLNKCFTKDGNCVVFWFDTPDGSTHTTHCSAKTVE